MRKVRSFALAPAILLTTSTVLAHEGHDDVRGALITSDIEISQVITAIFLLTSVLLYFLGLRRMWLHGGRGRGITVWSAAAFFCGWAFLAIALIGPFHTLSEALFFVHMTQHEILMLVAAPLIVLGRPQIAMVWAIPPQWRHFAADVKNDHAVELIWRAVSASFAAFLIHAAALWIWHIPVLFDATLASDWVHALQHLSFFGTALLFWWAIINSRMDWKNSFVGVLFLFLTSLHSGILGALLTFTREIWYPVYSGSTAAWGFTPLEDQQLGGLIMWVPAGLVYIGAGLAMFARLLGESEKRALRNEQMMLAGTTLNNL
jgi:cytochrome c oxidase assembly factor CtaG